MRWALSAFISTTLLASPAYGWGDYGHEIVATIAQIHLLPSAHQAICNILPAEYGCNLAKIAAWADEAKKQPRWKETYIHHFINAIDDNPPSQCVFGEHGWNSTANVLNGIVNATRGVMSLRGEEQDYALRFLVHYLGDVHQPLHLTGRDLGGNRVFVLFNNKTENLHWVWDDVLIQERIRLLTNYTERLPIRPASSHHTCVDDLNTRIESALHGAEYDPLVRWTVLEGINGWWQNETMKWAECPPPLSSAQTGQSVLSSRISPPFEDPLGLSVCPYYWSKPTHQVGCDFAWRSDFVATPFGVHPHPTIELNTAEYAGEAQSRKIVEKQLSQGGIRLATVLNRLLGSKEEQKRYGIDHLRL